MLAFTLSLVFRINGKESNLIFPLKIFPNIYDPRYIFPHLLLKRIWDCSYHKVISSETVKIFKRGSYISGNHIHGRGNLLLSAVLLGWIRLVYPAGGIPSVPGKALSPHWVDCLGRPQFSQARGCSDWQYRTVLHVLFWEDELRLLLHHTVPPVRVLSTFAPFLYHRCRGETSLRS